MRTLDEIIQHYQQVNQQATSVLPPLPGFQTPLMPQMPPYIVPNVFQQSYTPGVRPFEQYASQQARMPSGPGYAMPTPPPPPPMMMPPPPMPMVGAMMRPMFHDPHTASMQHQMGMLAMTPGDISAQIGARQGMQVGNVLGQGMGLAGGLAMPGLGGLALGAAGSWAGSRLGQFAMNNPVVNFMREARWSDAFQEMAGANQLRAGTFGGMAGMQGGAGFGGMGLSATGALSLNRQLGQTQVPGMNRQDLINLTRAAADTGFLDSAQNIGQITETVKKLGSVMGALARLTGDPDFRNNLAELRRFRDIGLDANQAVSTIRDMQMFGRMGGTGGMERAQRMSQMTSGMFQGMGLAGGAGMGIGAFAAGAVPGLEAGMTPTQIGTFGGREGMAQTLGAMQANFMGQTSQMYLPYVLEKGPGGKLRVNKQKLADIQSGRVNMQQAVAQGMANLGSLGFRSVQELLTARPELQSEMATQLGPVGGFTMMANQVRALQQQLPGITLDVAGGIVTGDVASGRLLAQAMQSPDFLRHVGGQLNEQIRRHSVEQGAAMEAQAAALPGAVSRWRRGTPFRETTRADLVDAAASTSGWWNPAQDILNRQGEQEMYATDAANERQRAEDEAMGIRRVHYRQGLRGSDAAVAAAGRYRASGRLRGAREGGRPSRRSGEDVEGFYRQRTRRLSKDELVGQLWGAGEQLQEMFSESEREALELGADIDVEGVFDLATKRNVNPRRIAEIAGGMEDVLRSMARGRSGIQRARKLGTDAADRGTQRLIKALSKGSAVNNAGTAVANMQVKLQTAAKDRGRKGRGMGPKQIEAVIIAELSQHMSPGEARKYFAKNEKNLVDLSYAWLSDSKDKDVRESLTREDVAGAKAQDSFSNEMVEQDLEKRRTALQEVYRKLGFSEGAVITEQEEGLVAAMFAEEDPEARAMAMTMAAASRQDLSDEERTRIQKTINDFAARKPDAMKKARALYAKMTEGQAAGIGKRLGGRVRSLEDVTKLGQQIEAGFMGGAGAGEFAGLNRWYAVTMAERAERERLGTETTRAGAGAGAGGPEIQALEEQKKMLAEMAAGVAQLPEASKELLEAAKLMKGIDFVRLMTGD